MDVISGRMGSGLNPDAAPYVPEAYRAVEDFSAEWWELVHSSPWFRDYWLRESFYEPQNDPDPDPFDIYDAALPDDADSLSSPPRQGEEEEKEKEKKIYDDKIKWEMMTWGAEKWTRPRGLWEGPKSAEKAPRFVNVKVSPRTIQQPR